MILVALALSGQLINTGPAVEISGETKRVDIIVGYLGQSKSKNYQYAAINPSTEKSEILELSVKIKGVKDIRPWLKRHPIEYAIYKKSRNISVRLLPIVEFGGAICSLIRAL